MGTGIAREFNEESMKLLGSERGCSETVHTTRKGGNVFHHVCYQFLRRHLRLNLKPIQSIALFILNLHYSPLAGKYAHYVKGVLVNYQLIPRKSLLVQSDEQFHQP